MKKYLPVIIIVLLLLVGSGVFLAFKNKANQTGAVGTNVNQSQNQNGTAFDTIKDALSKSLSLECTYNDEAGSETKTYIKGGAVRADSKIMSEGTETYSHVLFKDRKMYTWDPGTKKGTMFEVPTETMQEAQSLEVTSTSEVAAENKGASFLDDLEKYKDSCKPSAVSDALFTPPTDVEFQDLSSMFQNIPTGTMPEGTMPSGFNFEDFQEQTSPPN